MTNLKAPYNSQSLESRTVSSKGAMTLAFSWLSLQIFKNSSKCPQQNLSRNNLKRVRAAQNLRLATSVDSNLPKSNSNLLLDSLTSKSKQGSLITAVKP